MSRAAWILVFSLCVATRVQAQSSLPLTLDWQAPKECPDELQVRAELERIAHARPGLTLAPLVARAEVKSRSGARAHYTLQVQTEHEGQTGERSMEAKDCKTLVRTLTLVLALAFGAGVEIVTPSDEPPPEVAPEKPPAEPKAAPPPAPVRLEPFEPSLAPVRPSAAPAARKSRLPLSTALFAGGGAHFLLLPTSAGVLALGAELRVSALSLGLRALGAASGSSALTADVNTRFHALGGAVHGCGELPVQSLSAGLCGGGRVSALRGRASGNVNGRLATAPWYAASAAAMATWPRERALRVRMEAALHVSINRPRFVVEGIVPGHRVPRLSPELGLFVVWTP